MDNEVKDNNEFDAEKYYSNNSYDSSYRDKVDDFFKNENVSNNENVSDVEKTPLRKSIFEVIKNIFKVKKNTLQESNYSNKDFYKKIIFKIIIIVLIIVLIIYLYLLLFNKTNIKVLN